MTWAAILSGLLKAVSAVMEYLRVESLKSAGRKEQEADQLRRDRDDALADKSERDAVDRLSDAELDRRLREWSGRQNNTG